MIVLGIDPGPAHCGMTLYRSDPGVAFGACSERPLGEVLDLLPFLHATGCSAVAIERVQSYGISGPDLLATSEVVGRLWQRAADSGLDVYLVPRRSVLRALDVTGNGSRDAVVRNRLIEMHGGTTDKAVGRKANPGPLFGVTGHAWQALAVAVTVATSDAGALAVWGVGR